MSIYSLYFVYFETMNLILIKYAIKIFCHKLANYAHEKKIAPKGAFFCLNMKLRKNYRFCALS